MQPPGAGAEEAQGPSAGGAKEVGLSALRLHKVVEAADGDNVDDIEEKGPGWVDHPTAAAHGHLYRHRQ